MMDIVGAALGSVGLVSLIVALVILARFGKKLGAVTKMRPYYRGYYVASCLIGIALLVRSIRASVCWVPAESIPSLLSSSTFYLLLYHLPVVIGLCLGLLITWHYWGWLLKEQ